MKGGSLGGPDWNTATSPMPKGERLLSLAMTFPPLKSGNHSREWQSDL